MEKIVIIKLKKEGFEVLLFFRLLLIIIIIILAISVILILSQLKIKLSLFEFDLFETDTKFKYKGKVGLYFLGKIPLFTKVIDNEKSNVVLSNKTVKEKIDKKTITELLRIIRIDKLKMQIILDTENVLLTTYLVAIISAIIPNLIRNNIQNYNRNNYQWKITPVYNNKNFVYIKLNSIISIKVVHIINMFRLIGGKRNERTSNRRLNVNCYGEH